MVFRASVSVVDDFLSKVAVAKECAHVSDWVKLSTVTSYWTANKLTFWAVLHYLELAHAKIVLLQNGDSFILI